MATTRYDGSTDAMLPTHNTDPMSSNNPYASNSSTPGYNKPKKSRKKLWWILGALLALIIIVGAVLGGVLGSRAAKNNDSESGKAADQNGKPGSSNGGSAAPHNSNFGTGTKGVDGGNTGLPTLLSYYAEPNFAAQTQTGANGQVYIPVATDTYANPAYATGVSKQSRILANGRPQLLGFLLLPRTQHLAPMVLGPPTLPPPPKAASVLTHVSSLPSTSGTPLPVA